ncbi:site-specific integrase [Bacillus mycoides]|nr:site-specific integrase [Bacillus mycoides]QWI56254.1 site-specific integrase [Bacillus mycoides]QWI87794.1 site-specific integrase [Bacillus mycoides]
MVNQRGNFYNPKTLSNQVTDMIKKTNLDFLQYRENPVTAHTFRHAFAIMAVEQGNADLYHLMQTLGHENIQTTKIYLEKHMKRENNVGTSCGCDGGYVDVNLKHSKPYLIMYFLYN